MFGSCLLAPVLAEFGARHPGVCVELLTDARLYSLPRREADMVFRIKPFDEPEVIARRLLHIPYAVYAPLGFNPEGIAEGQEARIVTMDAGFSQMADAVWLRQRLPEARVAFRSNNRQVQARLCADGAGLAVLPRLLGDATPGIAAIDLGSNPPGRDTFVGYHKDMRRLARMRALLDLVVERLAN